MNLLAMDTEFVWDDGMERHDRATGEVRIPHAPGARIEVIGYCSIKHEDGKNRVALGVARGTTEAERVAYFIGAWERSKPVLATFNGRTADLPLLFARCMRHRIIPQAFTYDVVFANRYRSPMHLDMYDLLGNYGAQRSGGLDDWARTIGWPGKGDVDGSQVAGLLKTSEGRAKVEAYCIADAVQTAALALRFQLLTRDIRPEVYADAAAELLRATIADPRTKALGEAVDRDVWLMPATATEQERAA